MRADITLGILAGGRGSRLGGVDKAALAYDGSSLLARTLSRLAMPEDAARLLSHPAIAPADGVPAAWDALKVVPDLRPGQPGPLAGLEALLAATHTPWLLTAPVDLRDIPPDLGARLRACASGAAATIVEDADGLQPLVALWPVRATWLAVRVALDAGQRAARDLVAAVPHARLDLRPLRLGNLNTPRDFAA